MFRSSQPAANRDLPLVFGAIGAALLGLSTAAGFEYLNRAGLAQLAGVVRTGILVVVGQAILAGAAAVWIRRSTVAAYSDAIEGLERFAGRKPPAALSDRNDLAQRLDDVADVLRARARLAAEAEAARSAEAEALLTRYNELLRYNENERRLLLTRALERLFHAPAEPVALPSPAADDLVVEQVEASFKPQAPSPPPVAPRPTQEPAIDAASALDDAHDLELRDLLGRLDRSGDRPRDGLLSVVRGAALSH